jgi:hypothetical protein
MKRRNLTAKLEWMIFILFLICIGQAFPAVCGDVNSSGETDIIDALIVAQESGGLNPANFDASVADVNADGTINIIDAFMIARFCGGLVNTLGCSNLPTPSPSSTPVITPTLDPNRTQAPYPAVDASECGSWVLKDNVCCARYCSNLNTSEDCSACGGNNGALCMVVSSKASMSGKWPEVHAVSNNEPWHYSRSTHYGMGYGGACALGLYGVCSSALESGDPRFLEQCEAFCKAYPDLCKDPSGNTLRGNWGAPQGNYYTQFWPSLPGDRDNYLSCGECFEIVRTQKDGTDYQPGESGYTPPIILQVADSCPCAANSKWCCGSGRDHCYEVADFKYGCQLPPAPPNPPADRDPLPNESMHIDLCDIAMARLQTGDANGNMVDGVIPIKYRRVPCPVVGNVHVWLHRGASAYWFALSVVNISGLGSVTNVEAQTAAGDWVTLQRDPNYTSARPQERYGTWVIPQGAGPFALPISLRFTNPAGATIVATGAIKAWAPTDPLLAETYFIDTGVQF